MNIEMTWTRNKHGLGLTATWRARSDTPVTAPADEVHADATAPIGARNWQPRIIRSKQVATAA